MSNKSLEDLILKHVVIHYIQTPEPIGSSQLKEVLDLDVSAATIRNYLKKLVDSGYLDKLHSSSGRIPTSQAFKEYWDEQFCSNPAINIAALQDIKNATEFFGIYSVLDLNRANVLQNVYNVQDKWLLLEFDIGEFSLAYDYSLEIFLREFVGCELDGLIKIAYENMIDSLLFKLQDLTKLGLQTFNSQELISLAHENKTWANRHFKRFFDGTAIVAMSDGALFEELAPKDHLIVKLPVKVQGKPMSLMTLGHMSRDFNSFFNSF